MKKILSAILAVAMLLPPIPSSAQSDLRKVLIMTSVGDGVNSAQQTTVVGNTSGTAQRQIAEVHAMVRQELDRRGVPHMSFTFGDSLGGWRKSLGLATGRPAGVADTTWLRQNGFMGVILVIPDMTTGASADAIRFMTGGTAASRGAQAGSWLDGSGGIPVTVISPYIDNNAGFPFVNGASTVPVFIGDWALNSRHYFSDNGDSVAMIIDPVMQMDRNFQSDVTQIVASGDSSSGGVKMSAWRYKNSVEYFVGVTTRTRPTMILIAMSRFFTRAGYIPMRKTTFHWTMDHLYPENTYNEAASDSFLAYINANKWRLQVPFKAHGVGSNTSEYLNSDPNGNFPQMRLKWNEVAKRLRWPVHPHSHVNGVGNYFNGSPGNGGWNYQTYADTSSVTGIGAKWDFMERAIRDTIGIPLPLGPEKNIGFPGDGVHFPHLPIFANRGYTDIRVITSDSLGFLNDSAVPESLNRNIAMKVFSGPSNRNGYGYGSNMGYKYVAPNGRSINIHGTYSFPGSADTTWAQVILQAEGSQSYYTANATAMHKMSRSIIENADFYSHPNENLENPIGGNMPMSVLARRFQVYLNRISNIVEVAPHYTNDMPTRRMTPRW